MAADLAKLGIVVDSSQVQTANARMATMQGRAAGVQASMQSMGATAQRVGTMWSTFITAPMLAAGAAAGKFQSDFEDSLAAARAQADLTSHEISVIGDSAERTAIRTGESTDEIIEAYKFTMSAGLDLAESQELVGAAAEASAAGFGTQRNLVRLTTTALQAYDHQLDSSREFMDLLVGSAQAMELEVSKLGPAIQRNVSTAKELDISLEQLIGGIGSVSEIMGDADRGGRMFQTMLSKILQPTSEARANVERLYGSLDNFHTAIREDGLLQTMVELRQRLEEMGGGLEDFFTGQEGLEAALNFTNREGERTIEILEDMGVTAGSTKEAFEDSATFTRLLARSWEALKATLRPVGNIILEAVNPLLQDAIPMMQEFRDRWDGMGEQAQRTALKIAAAIGAGGPILIGLGVLTSAFAAISWPAVLGVAAFGAATATIMSNWEDVQHYFTEGDGAEMWETTKQLIVEFKNTATQLWNEFGDDIIGTTKNTFQIVSTTIRSTLNGTLKLMKKFNGDFDTELNIWEDNWLTTLDKIDGKIVNLATSGFDRLLSEMRWVSDRSYKIFLEPWVDMFSQAESKVGSTQKATSGFVQEMLKDLQWLNSFLSKDFKVSMDAPTVDRSWVNTKENVSQTNDAVNNLIEDVGQMPEDMGIPGMGAAEGSIADLQSRLQAFRNMRQLVDPKSEAFDELTESISTTKNEIREINNDLGETPTLFQDIANIVRGPLENTLSTAASEMLFFQEETRMVRNEFGQLEEQTYTLQDRLGELFESLLKDITKTLTQLYLVKPLMDSIYGAIGVPSGGQQGGWTNGNPTAMAGTQGDALVKSDGEIVPFHPSDNFLAMKDFRPLAQGIAKRSGGGGSEVNITIENHSGEQVQTERRQKPGGGMDLKVMIGNTVKELHNDGAMDSTMNNNYGIGRQPY